MGGGKQKKNSRRNKGGGNSDSAWVGKHRILVQTFDGELKSEFLVVDLKQQKIVMKHPEHVWSNNFFTTTAVFHEGTLSVLNICADKYTLPDVDTSPDDVDSSTSSSTPDDVDTCTSSTIDLTKDTPIWSNWKDAPTMNFRRHLPHRVVLGNKIFVFGGAIRDSPAVAEVYQIVGCGASSDDKWEKLTFPCGGRFNPRIKPVSDPSNNHRLIACFGDSLYAYYPKIEKWELLHQPLDGKDLFDAFSAIMVDQVVLRSLMLGFNSCQRRFMAYNIFTNKWLIVDDSNFVYKTYFGASKIYFGDRSELFHLGNDILCLADSYTTDRKTVLRFLRFSIKLVNEELVQLTPLSFHTIDMDDIDCFAITFSPF